MIKTILKLIIKVLENKLKKSCIEEKIMKNREYIDTAKQIWNVVEENFRITESVDKKLSSKADEFDKLLLEKFPELSENDVKELRQSIAGEINKGKAVVLDNSTILKQLQDKNYTLEAENLKLKTQKAQLEEKIAAITNYVTVENK
ncbi:hypothetical protein ACSW9O_15965 (plasmid) [Clostridium perfringens]|nr:hypothetical protein [Clostridium perfringens]